MTISQAAKSFGISARMLRYYEQAGLIESYRRDDYAYRMYNEATLLRLRQILVLRKLRIPIKQIKAILQKPDAVTAIEIFCRNISELDEEITALSTIRNILGRFVDELQKSADIQIHRLITQDDTILTSIESLAVTSINFREDKTMDNLKKAERKTCPDSAMYGSSICRPRPLPQHTTSETTPNPTPIESSTSL